ncbi:MAG: CsgG/HfaB family protein, partial [Candidatus Kaelpia aquatica]|nr:CsgG/HfaB family protein [Candidatus Kaelpia aquatica]
MKGNFNMGTTLLAIMLLGSHLVFAQESGKLAGPKKTVAVIGFENASGMRSYVRLGDDFTAQLTESLIQSGKFIVLSRTELSSVFIEQDLAESGRMAKSLTAQKGKAIPAQILVTGKITEFTQDASGGTQGLRVGGFNLGVKTSSAHMAVIIQIIDSTTGEILDSKRVEGKAKASGLAVGYSGAFDLGSSGFKKTPLGKATQNAIDKAVTHIAGKLSKIPWRGRVVLIKDEVVYINAGSEAGIIIGKEFVVYRKGESIIDPETGIELGMETTRAGKISVTEVQQKFSKAKILDSTLDINKS